MAFSTSSGPTVPQSTISDGDVRVVFKVYFLVVILGIAFIGGYCLKYYIQRQLLKGRCVPLTTTTGWVHGPVLAKVTYQLRRLPGGWLGALMLLTTALDLIAEFGIAKSITLVTQKGLSTARYGMIMGDDPNLYARFPDVVFQAFTFATSAQDLAWNNRNFTGFTETEAYGIYRFASLDYYFMPRTEDILGYWSCSRKTPSSIRYNSSMVGNYSTLRDASVLANLIDSGLMYNYSTATAAYRNVSDLTYNGTSASFQLFLWTASNYSIGAAPEFTFGVETQALDILGSKAMDVYNCSLISNEPTDVVQSVLRAIHLQSTIPLWINKLAGSMFPGFGVAYSFDPDVIEATLAYYLNAMIMIAGSTQQTDTPNTNNLSYGVFEYATVIPYWIIAIAVVTVALLLFMIGYFIFLAISNRSLKKTYERQGSQKVSYEQISEHTPVGLTGWMAQAAATSRDAELPEEKSLSQWILSTTWHGEKRLGVVKRDEHGLTAKEDNGLMGDQRGSEDTLAKEDRIHKHV